MRRACRRCDEAVAGWLERRFQVRLDPERGDRSDSRAPRRRSSASRRSSSTATVAETSWSRRSRATRSASEAHDSPAAEVVRLPLVEAKRVPARSRRRGTRDLAPRRPRLGQLPEQPDRLRPRRSTSSSGLAALARRHGFLLASDEAYSGALLRRAARLGAPGRRSRERRRRQQSQQALVDDRLPSSASWPATRI